MNKNTLKLTACKPNRISNCPHCNSVNIIRYGHQKNSMQRNQCKDCSKTFNDRHGTMFFHKKTHESEILKIVYMFLTGYPIELMVPLFEVTERTIRSVLNDAIIHFSSIRDFQPKPEDYTPRVIEVDEIYVKLQGERGFYGWLAYDPENKYFIDFVIGLRDNQTLEKLFRRLKVYRGEVELVVIDGYRGYEKLIRKYLGKKSKKPLTGVINKSKFDKNSNKFFTYALFGNGRRRVEELMEEIGIGKEISTCLIERFNGFIRDALACMRRRTRRLARGVEWVGRALTGLMILHNYMKGHWALSYRTSKNWIKEAVTPAMNVGITARQLSLREILDCRLSPTLK